MEDITKELKIHLPSQVEYIIEKLSEHGYEAYAVGGCVRDTMLHREPGDWDITTSAFPDQVKQIFRRTIDTGIAHGTVTVMLGGCGYEVTTYRIDGEYEDGRHPKSVKFTLKLEEDLKRRDFTINAMAYHPKHGLVDLFDGVGDLKYGMIRCVGEAKDRFMEDALRMMRAIRFAAQLGFEIEDQTQEAIRTLAPNLCKVSKERIQSELTKLLLSPNPQTAEKLFSLGLIRQVLPELADGFDGMEGRRMIERLCETEADSILRYTVFLSILGASQENRRVRTEKLLREFKFDNHTIEYVSRLSEHQYDKLSMDKTTLRRQIVKMGEDIFPYLLRLQKAEEAEQLYKGIKKAGDCLSVRELAVNGKDLVDMGIKPGKELGNILNKLLYLVLEKPEYNTKEKLLSELKNIR